MSAADLWNLYRHDSDKWMFERENDDVDLDEIFYRLDVDRVVFDYIDDKYSTRFFNLDQVPRITAQLVRACAAGDFQVSRGEMYLHEFARRQVHYFLHDRKI